MLVFDCILHTLLTIFQIFLSYSLRLFYSSLSVLHLTFEIMAALPQLSLTPYSGLEKENFREFEQLLRSILAVAAVPQAQQANVLQLHLRDAAPRYFQTLPVATCADLELSLTALRDHFRNPRLQELHVLKLENLKFDPNTNNPENVLVTLQTKALKAYPGPNSPAVAPIDGAAPDAAVEQT